jgi:hypothetical protein
MKKIILAVASVLALGVLASCQREISGDLTVTETTTDALKAKEAVYLYTASGSWTESSTFSNSAKAAGSAAKELTTLSGSSETVYTLPTTNVGVSVTVTTDPVKNYVDYSYSFNNGNAVRGTQTSTTVNYNTAGAASATYITRDDTVTSTLTIRIRKVDAKYYFQASDGSFVEIAGFNPLATEIDFSKLADVEAKTDVTTPSDYTTSVSGTTTTRTTVDAYSRAVRTSKKVYNVKITRK